MRVTAALLLVSVAILAAIAVPNLRAAQERGRVKRTMSDLRTIGTALESYSIDFGGVPESGSIDDLAAVLVPGYVRGLPRVDAWGNPFRYQAWRVEKGFVVPGMPDGYVVRSAGPDGLWEHEDPCDYEGGPWPRGTVGDILFGGCR